MPPRDVKTPQDSGNIAKVEPSWHQNRSKWKVIFENLKISQIVLSLQRGLDFRRFGAWFSDVKSMIFKRFFRRESARRPKASTRRYKTRPRRPETPPRRPKVPKTAPRRPQDAPKTPPGRLQDAPRRPPGEENLELESVFLADPLQTSILERLGLDFGRCWHRFWEVFWMVFKS